MINYFIIKKITIKIFNCIINIIKVVFETRYFEMCYLHENKKRVGN